MEFDDKAWRQDCENLEAKSFGDRWVVANKRSYIFCTVGGDSEFKAKELELRWNAYNKLVDACQDALGILALVGGVVNGEEVRAVRDKLAEAIIFAQTGEVDDPDTH